MEALKAKFADFSLTYSIGGQISFDVFPTVGPPAYRSQQGSCSQACSCLCSEVSGAQAEHHWYAWPFLPPRSAVLLLVCWQGWDKTYCLRYIDSEFDDIHFFGDKTFPVGSLPSTNIHLPRLPRLCKAPFNQG